MSNTLSRTKRITYSAMFAAIATVVMFFEFPLPFCPPVRQGGGSRPGRRHAAI